MKIKLKLKSQVVFSNTINVHMKLENNKLPVQIFNITQIGLFMPKQQQNNLGSCHRYGKFHKFHKNEDQLTNQVSIFLMG